MEQQHKIHTDETMLWQISTIRQHINNILSNETEKKQIYYYETGSKAAKYLARCLRIQQASDTIYTIKDPPKKTNGVPIWKNRKHFQRLLWKCIFTASSKRRISSSLDLLCVDEIQNGKLKN